MGEVGIYYFEDTKSQKNNLATKGTAHKNNIFSTHSSATTGRASFPFSWLISTEDFPVSSPTLILFFYPYSLPRLPTSPLGRHAPPNPSLHCSTPLPPFAASWNYNYP